MRVVLLSGWSGSGKDAVATYLRDVHGWRHFAFANLLKDMVAETHGLDVTTLHTAEGKAVMLPSGETVREALIATGKHIRDVKGPQFFAEHVAAAIHASVDASVDSVGTPVANVVVSDWRFMHEATVMQRLLPTATVQHVRVQRHGQTCSPVSDTDASEHELDAFPFDVIVENPGTTLPALAACIDACLLTI